jgi:hypothetical protein
VGLVSEEDERRQALLRRIAEGLDVPPELVDPPPPVELTVVHRLLTDVPNVYEDDPLTCDRMTVMVMHAVHMCSRTPSVVNAVRVEWYVEDRVLQLALTSVVPS